MSELFASLLLLLFIAGLITMGASAYHAGKRRGRRAGSR